jgi:hypothetical protein
MMHGVKQLALRMWLPAAGVFLAAMGGALVARGGISGFLLVFGTIVGISVFLLALNRPQVAPFLIIAMATIDKDVQFAGIQLTTSTLGLILFAPIFLRASVTSRLLPRYARVGSGMLVVGLLIACFTAADTSAAIPGTVRWVLVLNMVLGVAAMCATDTNLPRRLALGVVAAGAVAGVFGILQRQGQYFVVGAPYATDVLDSTFAYYSNFANFEALATVLGVGLVVSTFRGPRGRWLLLVVGTLLCGYGVSLSLSRGAVILVAVGLLVLMLKQAAKPAPFIGAAVAIAVVGWIVWSLSPKAAARCWLRAAHSFACRHRV